MAFAPSTLAAFNLGPEGRPPWLGVYFLGLLGPNGPLPLHLTEYARDRLRNFEDPTLARFLDIFHHRMLSLFYRAWARNQPTVSFDRTEDDRFGQYIASLCGLGMAALQGRDAMPDLAKLHFAGLLTCHTRHADGLQAILGAFLKVPFRIQEFVGAWMDIPEGSLCRLGESPTSGSLGMTVTIGARVWGRQHRFRIAVGPMSLEDYRRLLPGSESLRRLVAVVRNYVGLEFSWDLNMVLRKDEVPALCLGREARLGWTTWIKTDPFDHDAADLCLNAEAYVH